jgi:hypothetical protein
MLQSGRQGRFRQVCRRTASTLHDWNPAWGPDPALGSILWAACRGHLQAMRAALGRGEDPDTFSVNPTDSDEITYSALWIASFNGSGTAVEALCKAGADLAQKCHPGVSPPRPSLPATAFLRLLPSCTTLEPT